MSVLRGGPVIACAYLKRNDDVGRALKEACFIVQLVYCSGSSAGNVREACAGPLSSRAHATV